MEIAFKRRDIASNSEIALSLSSERSKWTHFAHSWACFDAKIVVHSIRRVNAIEITFKRRDEANRIDITHSFRQNRVNGRIFRTDLYVPTMKLACISLGVSNAMEIAFERRNIPNNSEIMLSLSSKCSKWSHFAHSWACFLAKTGGHSIRRVKCEGNSV